MNIVDVEPGDLVKIVDDPTPYVVIDVMHGGLVRVRPVHAVGLVVHPHRLEADHAGRKS